MDVTAFDLHGAPGHLIRRAQQRHQALWLERVGDRLTSVQFAALALLEREPDLDQRTLGERVSIDTSTLAEVCRRLADRGLLERARDPRDARRYVLRVTDAGAAVLREAIPAVDVVGEQLLAGLDAAERETLIALLRRVLV
ncbi:MAG: DNA-binding protein [Solirubrobacterales bacterium]|nr:DNA-binding protein [Solirubrobacterales bacterium]